MTLFARMAPAPEARSLENPNVPITGAQLAEILDSGNVSPAGVAVTQDRATTNTTYITCVRILAETLAMLPLPVYRINGRAREEDPTHRMYQLLHDRPNPELPAFNFREMLQGHLGLRGNAYAEIEYDNAGRIIGLWPLLAHRVKPIRVDGEKRYAVSLADGRGVTLRADQVLHIAGFGYDGLQGYTPLTLLRHALGLAIATEEFGSRFFGNGSRPGGIITRPAASPIWTDQAKKNFKRSWEEAHSGLSNAQRVAILEEGMDWKQIGMSPEDSQFLETRKFQVTEIARFFRIPLHMLNAVEQGTLGSVEQRSIEFVTHTMQPWVARWESVLNWDLFSEQERGRFRAQFDLAAFLRGDAAARASYFRSLFAIGGMSQNDIRRHEGEGPIDGGDRYYVPMNMVPTDRVDEWIEAQFKKMQSAGNQPANGNELADPLADPSTTTNPQE